MSKTKKLIELKVYDDIIQDCEAQHDNGKPYYAVIDALEKMHDIMKFKGCCSEFDSYIEKECLKYIRQSIEMANDEIPEKFRKDDKEKEWYMSYTLKQLKSTSMDSIRYFKQGYKSYCPSEI